MLTLVSDGERNSPLSIHCDRLSEYLDFLLSVPNDGYFTRVPPILNPVITEDEHRVACKVKLTKVR